MVTLLDVNVLVALCDDQHDHHLGRQARRWRGAASVLPSEVSA